ncbi:MAG: hypothetical protein AAF467_08990 [Actinomycetota bacterium]
MITSPGRAGPTPGQTTGVPMADCRGLGRRERLLLMTVGATPVSLVGASTFGVVDLKTLAVGVLLPGLLALAVLLTVSRRSRRLTAEAVIAGVVATFVYDLFRWAFLAFGWMDRDPIPHIGTALGLSPGWVFGYLWRFVGNGGGLALFYYAFGLRGVVAGVAFGLVVCEGLIAVLVYSPHGQQTLFPLVPATYVVAIVGHVIYGAVLGAIHLTRSRRRY